MSIEELIRDIKRRAGITEQDWYGGKHPKEMSQDEFVKTHRTGGIPSHAYDKSVEDWKRDWASKKKPPHLVGTLNIKGEPIELRKSGEELKYLAHDEQGEIARDEQGLALYMTPEEIEAEGKPLYDRTIWAYHGDEMVGYVSDEWGAIGVWIREDFQRAGLGSKMLQIFMKENPGMRIGQMTPQGEEMTRKTWQRFQQDEDINEIRRRAGLPVMERRVEQTPYGRLYENPNNQQLLVLLKRNVEKYKNGIANADEAFIRGFADFKNNTFWMWDPFEATHDQMGKFISKFADVEFGYDDNERPVGMLPIIISDHPIHEETIGFSAPDTRAWSHPAVRRALQGLPLSKDRLGDYDMEYEAIP